MKIRLLTAVLGLSTSLVAVLGISAPAGAEPYRSQDKCYQSPILYDTNEWNFFLTHKIRVNAAQCHNGTFVKWAAQPQVSFPSSSPGGAMESITLTKAPTIKSITPFENGASKIVWQFSVQQKVFKLPFPNDFDITYTTYPASNQLCSVGGSCDPLERDW